ncbi:hypothetical protein NDU88_000790 [Pleurodeles waltl]|uniref:Uncharacterized protein n=1 Tax=Pleurodeles waltl TaxID=8319 RepID=A0AAV7L951_PLEWA|nr:hypothetical protein NDU88_000790 [Pleurodeles waltl]
MQRQGSKSPDESPPTAVGPNMASSRGDTEDDPEEDVFLVSYTAQNSKSRRPQPHCHITITGKLVVALIDTRDSVSVMTYQQYLLLDPCPPVSRMHSRIYA